MSQIALPLSQSSDGPARIVLGEANRAVAEALGAPDSWPFGTAILCGPPRSGKSLFARLFARSGPGVALDDAHSLAEDEVFHRWNAAQESGTPLLIVAGRSPWRIALPDLRSRMGAALQLQIAEPDDMLARELIASLADERGLLLGADAADYLVPRATRSWAGLERLVATIDRLALERKVPATQAIWRAALDAVAQQDAPRLR